MKRKQFVNKMGAAALLGSLGLSVESCTYDQEQVTPQTTPDGEPQDQASGTPQNLANFSLADSPFDVLQQIDGWLLHPSADILLLNVAGEIIALDSVCTHSGCSTNWEYDSSRFTCTCHFSVFDNEGKVVVGPAQDDLTQLKVERDGNNITITQ